MKIATNGRIPCALGREEGPPDSNVVLVEVQASRRGGVRVASPHSYCVLVFNFWDLISFV